MQLPLTGACQCRNVRYQIAVEPLGVWACHCTECQRQSGSAFALSMVVAREAIAVTAGQQKTWARRADSGRMMDCVFCGDCGTRLYHNPHANAAITIVKPGTLDDASWLVPVGHIWTNSAQAWFAIPADGVNYPAQPPDFSRLIEAWRQRNQARH